MVLKSSQVNKVFVGMSVKEANELMTEKCKKCGHLIDDHFLPVNRLKKRKNDFYTCRNCGCKIK